MVDDLRRRGPERRGLPRLRSRTLADGTLAGSAPGPTFLGATIDLSPLGASVRTYEPIATGQRLRLRLHLPEGDVEALGTVQHSVRDAIGCTIAGIAFERLADGASARLAAHLAAIRPLAASPFATATSAAAVVGFEGAIERDDPT